MNETHWTNSILPFVNNSTSSFDSKAAMGKMKEISDKMRSIPSVLVMTTRTLGLVRPVIEAQEIEHRCCSSETSVPTNLGGIQIESYVTVRECLDRMVETQPSNRLLVLSEDIPGDCFDHPWMKTQAQKILDHLKLDELIVPKPFISRHQNERS